MRGDAEDVPARPAPAQVRHQLDGGDGSGGLDDQVRPLRQNLVDLLLGVAAGRGRPRAWRPSCKALSAGVMRWGRSRCSRPAPAARATIRQSRPMPPTPMTTTSSPTCIWLYWITPFHAPDSGSVSAAASKDKAAGLWNRQLSVVSMYSAKRPANVLRPVAAGGEGVFAIVRVARPAMPAGAAVARGLADHFVAFVEVPHARARRRPRRPPARGPGRRGTSTFRRMPLMAL